MDGLNVVMNLIDERNYEYVLYIIISLISIWSFKEFRLSYIESKKQKEQTIRDTIEVYTQLFLIIGSSHSTSLDKEYLIILLGKSMSLLPEYITQRLFNYHDESNFDLNQIKQDLIKEIIYLKENQYSITCSAGKESTFKNVQRFFVSSNFDSYIYSFTHTSLFMFFLLVMSYMMILVNSSSILNNVTLIFLFCNIIISFSIFCLIIDYLLSKKIKIRSKLFLLFLITVPLPFLFIYLSKLTKFAFLHTAILVMFVIFLKKSKGKNKN